MIYKKKHPTHYLCRNDATKCRQHWIKWLLSMETGGKWPSMVLNVQNEAKKSHETIYIPVSFVVLWIHFFDSRRHFARSILFPLQCDSLDSIDFQWKMFKQKIEYYFRKEIFVRTHNILGFISEEYRSFVSNAQMCHFVRQWHRPQTIVVMFSSPAY